ncbi:hypothetical protein EVJ58_g8976 [Rhodofomes roseus]|uniref:Uncharacterized protein n=1 Tax=Rhodofomes roseus TaxID=34475 RepID=A0A4Y9XXX5_9APHY|nr:hypothetical protein EVJ58_g8976 [Rhodofomes roseus]
MPDKAHSSSGAVHAATATPTAPPTTPVSMSKTQRALRDVEASNFNLASKNLLDHVCWMQASNGIDVLVEKNDGADDDEAQVEAHLLCVCKIDSQECWFFIDGAWNSANGDFHKTKARSLITHGSHRDIVPTWETVTTNLTRLQESAKAGSPGTDFYTTVTTDRRVRVRHQIFIEKKDGEEEPENGDYPMESWVCRNPTAQAELQRLILAGTHYGQVLPAYDADNKLIDPAQYQSKLRGAVVKITVAMSHQFFVSAKKHNWYLDIRRIKVINEPLPMPKSPSKRRATDNIDGGRKTKKSATTGRD